MTYGGNSIVELRIINFFSVLHSSYSKIDYFFMFNKDIGRIGACKMGVMDLFDHSPIYMDIQNGQNKDFSWRLTSNALKGQLKAEPEADIQKYLEENDNKEVSPLMVWDAYKGVVGEGFLLFYSSLKRREEKRKRQEKLNIMESELKKLDSENQNRIHSRNPSIHPFS